MCGRATLTTPADSIAEIFEVPAIEIGPPRFNLAPTQPLVTVRADAEGAREMARVRWGLVPWWAKADEWKKLGARCIQARAETARNTPAYRDSFKKKRCLVVVDGFFEWSGEGKTRAPFLAHLPNSEPFAIAGLWDVWRGGDAPLESGTVLTTRAAGPLRAIGGRPNHPPRMPLVLERSDWNAWLTGTDDEAAALLHPSESDRETRAKQLVLVPVSKWVNDAKHDDPRCIAPPEPNEDPGGPARPKARLRSKRA